MSKIKSSFTIEPKRNLTNIVFNWIKFKVDLYIEPIKKMFESQTLINLDEYVDDVVVIHMSKRKDRYKKLKRESKRIKLTDGNMFDKIKICEAVDGKKLTEVVREGKIKQDRLLAIIDRTKKGGAEIVKYLEKGSAFYAPAASGVEMAESYLKNLKKELPCAAYLNGEYGVTNLYAGVPVIIGAGGVEKVIEIDLSEEEKVNFNNSIKSVKALFDAAANIDSYLNN